MYEKEFTSEICCGSLWGEFGFLKLSCCSFDDIIFYLYNKVVKSHRYKIFVCYY